MRHHLRNAALAALFGFALLAAAADAQAQPGGGWNKGGWNNGGWNNGGWNNGGWNNGGWNRPRPPYWNRPRPPYWNRPPYGPGWGGQTVVVTPPTYVQTTAQRYYVPAEYAGTPAGSVINYGGINYVVNGDGTMSPYGG